MPDRAARDVRHRRPPSGRRRTRRIIETGHSRHPATAQAVAAYAFSPVGRKPGRNPADGRFQCDLMNPTAPAAPPLRPPVRSEAALRPRAAHGRRQRRSIATAPEHKLRYRRFGTRCSSGCSTAGGPHRLYVLSIVGGDAGMAADMTSTLAPGLRVYRCVCGRAGSGPAASQRQ